MNEDNTVRNIELLAPAGNMDCLKAAINAGCDAVYASGACFGARAYAKNFDQDEMIEAIKYCHLFGKKIYITVNTLLKNEELNKLYSYLKPYYEAGVDAVIVQDVGVLKYINKCFKDLPIHLSTQMTLMTSMGISQLKKYGVRRVVTPRELSLSEISQIKKECDIEIEAFIHGALCYCYSGQCLMSSMIGNRSGNRGRCAQPCRKEYSINGNKSYLLSTKDLCSLELIDKIIESGVESFKIEGRMKKAEYVALVVSTYRKYIDNYLKNGYITINKSEISKDKEKLMDIYNRGGFTDGYFLRHNGKEMMSYNRPNHYGVKVGKVVKVDKNKCDIKLEKGLNGKDVLEIRAKDVLNEDTYEFTLKDMDINESIISTRFKKNLKIRKNQEVFRVRNQKLIDDISRKYIKNDIKKSVSIKFLAKKGENMKIFLKDIVSDTEIECISDIIVQKADNMPVSSERIKRQLLKFSDTIFEPYIQEMDIDDDIFIPIGKINELRRKAVIDLTKKIVSSFYRTSLYNINSDKTSYNERSRSKDFYYSVLINKCEMVNVILNYPQIKRVYIDIYDTNSKKVNKLIDILHENKKQVYIALPHILRYDNIESFINEYKDSIVRSDGLLARNFEGIKIARNNKKNLIVDYNMYSFNDYAIDTFRELGVDEYTACTESSKEEINKMRDKDLELIVYGYIDVMLSASCINKNINKCTKKSKILNIKGDKRQFKVRNVCKYCYNIIYNDRPILLEKGEINNRKVRIDLTFENENQADEILQFYIYDKKNEKLLGTKGHFTRSVD